MFIASSCTVSFSNEQSHLSGVKIQLSLAGVQLSVNDCNGRFISTYIKCNVNHLTSKQTNEHSCIFQFVLVFETSK